jgi:hypothetical protein
MKKTAAVQASVDRAVEVVLEQIEEMRREALAAQAGQALRAEERAN